MLNSTQLGQGGVKELAKKSGKNRTYLIIKDEETHFHTMHKEIK